MTTGKPVTMMCTYRAKPGKEEELLALVQKHWPVLDRAGLVTKEPAIVYRASDKRTNAVSFVEIFSWKDDTQSGVAHQLPEVMKIWEPMGPILEGGGPQLAVLERVGG
jgi:hypothetical protein